MPAFRDVLRAENRELVERKRELLREVEIIERKLSDNRVALKHLRREPTTGENRGGNERYIVRASYLRPVLNHYIKTLGNKQYVLAERATVSARTIRDIRKGNRQQVAVSTADRLLTAMGIGDLLGTDEFPVEVNQYSWANGRPPVRTSLIDDDDLSSLSPEPPPSHYYEP